MTLVTRLGLALLLGLASVPSPARAEDAPLPPDLTQRAVEKIVRDYLLKNPEVVYEALQELQKRREANQEAQTKAAVAANRDQIFKDATAPVLGAADGDVELVAFFDYHCGYCRQMTDGIQALLQADPKLRLTIKELPILGPDSIVAAKAALAADKQGKYPPFHLALMRSPDISKPAVLAIAKAQGLDMAQLEKDMASPETAATIAANLKLASDLGIGGTPSFVIGDTLVPGAVDPASLGQMVAAERERG